MLAVIVIGITAVFFITRLSPTDPVVVMLNKMTANNTTTLDPATVQQLYDKLSLQFGLTGTLWEQYLSFMKSAITFDFGSSIMYYPTSVSEIVARYLPYTLGLMLVTTILAWIIGNLIGLVTALNKKKVSSKIMEDVAILIYPIPYMIVAILLQMLFCYNLKWFSLTAKFNTIGTFWDFMASVISCSILPGLALLLINLGWWIISMKSVASGVIEEPFVEYARYRGIPNGRIARRYVFRNAIIPQVNGLAISLGNVFGGSIVTEIVFGYPGVGSLCYSAILASDYNMILGIVSMSIVAVTVCTFIADLIYPLIDPRIRYQ
ncbi:MAG: ABC transporter permease [Eubacteriales bacterium]|nr:ABC transporter permease [Eubacteriales bacterium]